MDQKDEKQDVDDIMLLLDTVARIDTGDYIVDARRSSCRGEVVCRVVRVKSV